MIRCWENQQALKRYIHLGDYSKKFPVKGTMFQDFEKGSSFDWQFCVIIANN
jgi:hypothetical protein